MLLINREKSYYMQHSKIHPWKSLMRQRTCSWLTRLQSLLAQQRDKGEGCFYSQFGLLLLHPENLPLQMLLNPAMPVSEGETQHAVRATRLSENHPTLTTSGYLDLQKPCRRVCGARIYRCALVSKPNVQHSLLLQADTWKKIQFSSFKTNSDNQLVKLRL